MLHLPQLRSRHKPTHVVVKFDKAPKVFDASNESMGADPWNSITVVSNNRKGGIHQRLLVSQKQPTSAYLNWEDLKIVIALANFLIQSDKGPTIKTPALESFWTGHTVHSNIWLRFLHFSVLLGVNLPTKRAHLVSQPYSNKACAPLSTVLWIRYVHKVCLWTHEACCEHANTFVLEVIRRVTNVI